jgi:hypothetical protein
MGSWLMGHSITKMGIGPLSCIIVFLHYEGPCGMLNYMIKYSSLNWITSGPKKREGKWAHELTC